MNQNNQSYPADFPVPSQSWIMAKKPLTILRYGFAAFALSALPLAHAEQGYVKCPEQGQPLLDIPEIARDPAKNRLRGDITVTDQARLLWFNSSSGEYCASQYMRYFDNGKTSTTPSGLPEPLPGPTLRARVGDTVELTFLNQINPMDFPSQTMDRDEQGKGCDETSVYPKNTGDTSPNCFHGSSTTNLHFHGSHTSPNTTADNVLIQVKPSPRKDGRPIITKETVAKEFDEFFEQCEKHLDVNLGASTAPVVWPTGWEQLTEDYRTAQEQRLADYDKTTPYKEGIGLPEELRLLGLNRRVIAANEWPQNYVGAYPYCFKLPAYREPVWPPANSAALQMGQAPGTHWYHAHKHGATDINVLNSMVGAFIVEGDYDDKLRGFYDNRLAEKVLVIQQLGSAPNLESNSRGVAKFSVNGRRVPVLTMRPGEVQLWRFLNSASRSGAYLAVPTQQTSGGSPVAMEWRQTAQDGVQLDPKVYAATGADTKASILLASGNRADILVKAPATPGQTFTLNVTDVVTSQEEMDNTPTALFTVKVEGAPLSMDFPPTARFPQLPPFLADIGEGEVSQRRTLTFDTQGANHTIDGKKFSEEIAQTMEKNKAEEWLIVNKSTGGRNISHPFHIHINPFQVVEEFDPTAYNGKRGQDGKPQPLYLFDETVTAPTWKADTGQCRINPKQESTWAPCAELKLKAPFVWWDVFPIPSAATATLSDGKTTVLIPGYFKMRSRFDDYPGRFVLHCHILAHEDRGMMQLVEVSPAGASLQARPMPSLLKHH